MTLPVKAIPAGYSSIIDAYNLQVPFPYILTAIGLKHKVLDKDNWHILTPGHEPKYRLPGQLEFALKHEGIDLCVLKKLY